MALTYLDAAMIEQPTELPYLSAGELIASNLNVNNLNAENLTVNSILENTDVFGNLTVYGSITALSGIDFVNTITATTSSLSVVNTGAGPALYIEQGPSSNGVASFVGDGVELVKINNINPALGLASLAVTNPTTGPAISAQGTSVFEATNIVQSNITNLVATNASISSLNLNSTSFPHVNAVTSTLSSTQISAANIITGTVSQLNVANLNASQILTPSVSATNAVVDNLNFPVAGGYVYNNAAMYGNLTVYGSISALSGLNLISTTTSQTSSLSVVNTGAGPALYVQQAASPEGIAVFVGDGGTQVLKINNTLPDNNPGLIVTGLVSATSVVYASGGNSNIWNNTTTIVQNNSATTWNYQGTDLKNLSGNWQSTYTTVQSNSANWQTGYNLGTTYSTASSSFMRRYATNIGNGSLTAFTVTHNLGTRDVITSVYDNSTYENIITSVANTTTNTVSLSFSTAPGTNAYRVVVIG